MEKKIWIKVNSDKYYKILKKLNDLEIEIFDIKKIEEEIYFKIYTENFEKIKKFLYTYEFKYHSLSGIYSIKEKVINNKLTLFFSLFSALLLLVFNNIIVDVEIMHESSELINILESELTSYDIKVLSFKKDYEELTKIKNNILNDYKDKIDWLEIEIVGMKYIIKVEERIINIEETSEEYCNVYATSNAKITEISVETGILMVSLGDFVKEGDLLISGDIIYNDKLMGQVCAQGIIKGEKWYETSITVPLNYFEDEKTGLKRYNFIYEHEQDKIRILNSRIENFESEETILFDILGFKLYLETQYEVKRNYFKYSETEAINKALTLAEDSMLLKLSENEQILQKKVLKKTQNNSTIEVDIFMVTEEVVN